MACKKAYLPTLIVVFILNWCTVPNFYDYTHVKSGKNIYLCVNKFVSTNPTDPIFCADPKRFLLFVDDFRAKNMVFGTLVYVSHHVTYLF